MWRALIVLLITRHKKKGDQFWLSDERVLTITESLGFVNKVVLEKLPEISY